MPPTTLAGPLGAATIFLDSKDVDMRKTLDGLHAIVQQEFERDVRAGDLFLFLNRRTAPAGDELRTWLNGRVNCVERSSEWTTSTVRSKAADEPASVATRAGA